jgi:hypothetical protein
VATGDVVVTDDGMLAIEINAVRQPAQPGLA